MTTLVQLLNHHAKGMSQRPALTTGNSSWTFGELASLYKTVYDALTKEAARHNEIAVVVLCDSMALTIVSCICLLSRHVPFKILDPGISQAQVNDILTQRQNTVLFSDRLINAPNNVRIVDMKETHMLGFTAEEFRHATDKPGPHSFEIASLRGNKIEKVLIDKEDFQKSMDQMDQSAGSVTPGTAYLSIGQSVFYQTIVEITWAVSRGIHYIQNESKGTAIIRQYLPDDDSFPMDFSLFYFGSYPDQTNDNDKYHFLLESAKYADDNQFTAVWTPERHFNEFGGLFPNPSILGAALAVKTRNIQIRSGSIVSPLHQSVRIAEDWSVVDNLSGGRAALSFASGWQCDDFVFFPERYADRHNIMLRQIGEVRSCWEGKGLTLKNGLQQDINVQIFPKPIQSTLPVWVTVSGKKETFVDAGKLGANILTHLLWQDPSELIEKIEAYRESLASNGFDPQSHTVSVMLHTFVGNNDEEVKQLVEKPLKDYIRSSVHLIEAMTRSTANSWHNSQQAGRYGNMDEEVPAHLLDELIDIAFNRFFDNAALLGSPAKCHQLLKRLRGYGINELACLIDFGLPGDTILEGLKHLNELKDRYTETAIKKYPVRYLRCNEISDASLSDLSQKELQGIKKIFVADNHGVESLKAGKEKVILNYSLDGTGKYAMSCKAISEETMRVNYHQYAAEFTTPVKEDF